MVDLRPENLRQIPSLTGIAPHFDTSDLPGEPIALFSQWLDVALQRDVPEPLASTLSTVDSDGLPDARVLVLKGVDEHGWAFAGTASSRKGRQLAAAPRATLSFWWQPIVRAVRVSGPVTEASAADCAADLAARSESARAGVEPGDWRLWRLQPTRVEFWQGSEDRRHVRVVFTQNDGWTSETL